MMDDSPNYPHEIASIDDGNICIVMLAAAPQYGPVMGRVETRMITPDGYERPARGVSLTAEGLHMLRGLIERAVVLVEHLDASSFDDGIAVLARFGALTVTAHQRDPALGKEDLACISFGADQAAVFPLRLLDAVGNMVAEGEEWLLVRQLALADAVH